jgi:hypothetical protein
MVRTWSRVVSVVIGVLLVFPAAIASAQVVGTIVGSVYDQTGQPLSGVKISATSPTQIGGAKVTYTDKDGEFRVAALQPGVFTVTASAPKMTTFEQRGVNVGVSAPAQVTIVLEVQTEVEQIKIVEKAPVVNTRNATVKETFDEDFLDKLPLNSRDSYEGILENNTPGVAYGDTGRSRGGDSKANVFMMDGFRINSHNVQGVGNQLATLKTVAAMEVQTAGYGAEYATAPGAVMNLVTKSGSNRYEFDFSGYHENNKLQLKERDENPNTSFSTKLNINFSGPIIRDRLWFFSTVELGQRLAYRDSDPLGLRPQLPPNSQIDLRGTVKLTWQVTPRNKLQTIQKVDYNDRKHTQGDYGAAVEADLLTKDQNSLHTLRWESLVTDNLLFRPGVAYNRFQRHWVPESCRISWDDCLDIQPYVQEGQPFSYFNYNNYTEARQLSGQSYEALADVDWFVKSKVLGDHDVRLTGRYFRETFEELRYTPSGSIIYWRGTVPDRRVWWYSNDPRVDAQPRIGWNIQSAQSIQAEVALQDSFRPTRYTTFTPGVAFVNAGALDRNGNRVLDFTNILPSISAAWDATHDGRTSLRGSFSQRTQLSNADMGRFALGSRVNQTCRWNATSGDFTDCGTYGGDTAANKSFGSPCGPDGLDENGVSCRRKVKAPQVREYTLGAEREIVQGVALGADFIYRHYYNLLEAQETNRVWNESGTALDAVAPFKDGRNTTYTNLDNVPGAKREYRGVTLNVRKREGAFRAQFAYTLAWLKGNVLDSNVGFQPGSAFGENPGRDAMLYGYLPDDARHSIRSSFAYQWNAWFSSGLTWSYTSGRPYSRKFRNDVDGGFNDYRSRVGEDPGANINDPGDDRAIRRPDITEVNVQLRTNLKPLTGWDSELYLDVLNVLAQRTPTRFRENDGPTWGTWDQRTNPFRVRLGFAFKY